MRGRLPGRKDGSLLWRADYRLYETDSLRPSFLPESLKLRPEGDCESCLNGHRSDGKLLVGIAALGESANVWRIVSAALIVLGVCGLRFTSIKVGPRPSADEKQGAD